MYMDPDQLRLVALFIATLFPFDCLAVRSAESGGSVVQMENHGSVNDRHCL